MEGCIGIDFGGVIITSSVEFFGEDTALVDSYGSQIAKEGLYGALREIVSTYAGRVWIVSKAGPSMQAKTIKWLDAENFFVRTGMNANYVRFCLQRQDKAHICRELGITHFVDDRIHIMQILRYVVPNLYLFGESGGEKHCPPWAKFVLTWTQVTDMLTCPSQDSAFTPR